MNHIKNLNNCWSVTSNNIKRYKPNDTFIGFLHIEMKQQNVTLIDYVETKTVTQYSMNFGDPSISINLDVYDIFYYSRDEIHATHKIEVERYEKYLREKKLKRVLG